ncbi:8396_t:CDS:2, partial [Diversispora eburnea]
MAEIISDTESKNSQENVDDNELSVSREASNSNLTEASNSNLTKKIDIIAIIACDKSYKAAKDSSTSTLRGHIAYEHKQLDSEISTSGPLDKFVKSKTALA